MDHSNKNSSGSESNASVICKGYSFSNLAEPVQIHRETYTRTATIQTPVTGDTNGMTRQSVRKPHMNDHHLHRRWFKIDNKKARSYAGLEVLYCFYVQAVARR